MHRIIDYMVLSSIKNVAREFIITNVIVNLPLIGKTIIKTIFMRSYVSYNIKTTTPVDACILNISIIIIIVM